MDLFLVLTNKKRNNVPTYFTFLRMKFEKVTSKNFLILSGH